MEVSKSFNYLDLRTKQSVFLLSGPSGSGKNALMSMIRETMGDKFERLITVTTRKPREEDGEKDGVDYYFVTPEEFEARVEKGLFVEWAWVHGNRYGMLKSELERVYNKGSNILILIDVQGRRNLKEWGSDEFKKSLVDIFIAPPSIAEIASRIRKREGEFADDQYVKTRMMTALTEMPFAFDYRHIVVNKDLDKAVEDLKEIFTFYLSSNGEGDRELAKKLEDKHKDSIAFLHHEFDQAYDFKLK